jgi:O-antigen ligase
VKALHRPNLAPILLAAALIYFVLLGGSDAGQEITALRAIGALISGGLIAWALAWGSRVGDRSDRLVILSLLFFLGACAFSQFPRFSFDAATTALALLAAFLVAREVLASPSARNLAITALGLCGIVLAVAFVALWGAVWIRWLSIPGAGLPPLDLILPVGPYRHYHVVGMTVAMLLPAIIVLSRRPAGIRAIAIIGMVAAISVIVMSGSRTVWLATVAGLALPPIAQRAGLLRRVPVAAYVAAGAIALLVFVSGAATPVLSRLAGTSTIALRSEIWRATFDRWLAHPIAGSGPGTFSVTLTLGDYFAHFPDVGRHADSAVIQLLAEAGVLGIVSLLLLAAALIAGVRQRSQVEWAPVAGLLIFVFGSFTDNPSDTSSLVVIGLAWAALATAREGGVAPNEISGRLRRFVRQASFAGAGLVAIAVTLTILASGSFDQARASARQGDGARVVQQLSQAVRLDPAFALYRRERGLWSEVLGDHEAAMDDLMEAHRLDVADATTLRALALFASASGEDAAAIRWAEDAVKLRATHAENRMTLAYVAGKAGDQQLAAAALAEVLRREPWIAAASDWARLFPSGGSLVPLLGLASKAASEAPGDDRLLLSDAWLAAELGLPAPAEMAPDVAASYAIIDCRFSEAKLAIQAMSSAEATGSDALQARVLVATATKDPARKDVLVLASLRWPLLGIIATEEIGGASPFSDPSVDLTIYRRRPMQPADLGLSFPTSTAGISVWLREPSVAAHFGAPGSRLDRCSG